MRDSCQPNAYPDFYIHNGSIVDHMCKDALQRWRNAVADHYRHKMRWRLRNFHVKAKAYDELKQVYNRAMALTPRYHFWRCA